MTTVSSFLFSKNHNDPYISSHRLLNPIRHKQNWYLWRQNGNKMSPENYDVFQASERGGFTRNFGILELFLIDKFVEL